MSVAISALTGGRSGRASRKAFTLNARAVQRVAAQVVPR